MSIFINNIASLIYMEELFLNSFSDEVNYYLESNENPLIEIDNNNERYFRDIFPLFSYLYFQEIIPNLRYKNGILSLNESNISSNKSENSFIIPTANPIQVDMRREIKSSIKYSNLENILQKNQIKLNHIIDIEFFEYFPKQKRLIKNLEKTHNSYTKSPSFNSLLWGLKKEEEKDFEQILTIDKKINSGILTLYDILEENTVKTDIFTSFLDTEKIHLQFANISYGSKQENVLVYFGYGNYYPFTRNIKSKNSFENRLNRLDYINTNQNETLEYIQSQLGLDPNNKKKQLLDKINSSQEQYEDHFTRNLDREIRLQQFKGTQLPLGEVDRFFMINPSIRTKSAALIAYNLIDRGIIE